MGFRSNTYATVWDVNPVSETMTKIRLSTSKKDKKSGEYETEVMQSDFLTAIKEEEYNMYNGTVTVSEEDSQQQCVRIEVPSYSITNLAVKVQNTK